MSRADAQTQLSLSRNQQIATLQAIMSAMGIRDNETGRDGGFSSLARIAAVVTAFRGLSALFADPACLAKWVKTPNHHPICAGEAPADLLLGPCETRAWAVSNWIQSFQAA